MTRIQVESYPGNYKIFHPTFKIHPTLRGCQKRLVNLSLLTVNTSVFPSPHPQCLDPPKMDFFVIPDFGKYTLVETLVCFGPLQRGVDTCAHPLIVLS